MPAPKGHEKWGNPLKPKTYTPEALWEKALEYFNWCDENPWVKEKTVISDKGNSAESTPTKRPYTQQGLIVYLNISLQTFYNYREAEGYETHFEVAKHISNIIEQNQLEGATVGTYNSSIVSRLLGLVDKTDMTSNGKEIQPKNTIIFGGKEIQI